MLVGLTGLARSGKDTVGEYLETKGFQRKSFAAPMKIIAREIDPILDVTVTGDGSPVITHTDGTQIFGNVPVKTEAVRLSDVLPWGEDAVKASFPEYRRFLQRLGTEAFRGFDEEFWINWLFNELDATDPAPAHVCITDARFPNEVDKIRERGGVMWRIEREGVDTTDLHASEAFIQELDVDVTILNNGTLSDLYRTVDSLLGV